MHQQSTILREASSTRKSDGTVRRNNSWDPGGTINNAGLFKKSAGAGTTTIGYPWTFNNSGIVEVQTGNLDLMASGTSSGTYNILSGAAINFPLYLTVQNWTGASVNNAGTININSGTVELGGAILNGGGIYNVNGGVARFNSRCYDYGSREFKQRVHCRHGTGIFFPIDVDGRDNERQRNDCHSPRLCS